MKRYAIITMSIMTTLTAQALAETLELRIVSDTGASEIMVNTSGVTVNLEISFDTMIAEHESRDDHRLSRLRGRRATQSNPPLNWTNHHGAALQTRATQSADARQVEPRG